MPLCDKFISGLNTSEERVSELEDISIETSHTEKQKENKTENKQTISKNCGTTTRGVMYK